MSISMYVKSSIIRHAKPPLSRDMRENLVHNAKSSVKWLTRKLVYRIEDYRKYQKIKTESQSVYIKLQIKCKQTYPWLSI